MTSVPKATLYSFPAGSVWSAVPLLTALEKGFTDNELEKRTVNLLEGQNFAPAFLKISPKGTVPALVAPYSHTTSPDLPTKYKSLTSTVEIADFLDASTLTTSHPAPSLSPATIQGSADSTFFIQLVHSESAPDPNALLLSFRSDEERQAKLGDVPGKFLKGRQEALERYAKESEGSPDASGRLATFYENKIKENGGLLAIYEGKQDAQGWIETSKKMWSDLSKTVQTVEEKLGAGFAVGDQIALADLHVGAFFARVLAVVGATSISDLESAIPLLDKNLVNGAKVGPKLTAYLTALFARESFQEVYGEGLH